MPSITLILADVPGGSVSIHSSFRPAVGHPCSPAQAAALEMINRTHKQWGVHPATAPAGPGVDAVQRLRPVCAWDLEPTMQEADTGHCMACGGTAPLVYDRQSTAI